MSNREDGEIDIPQDEADKIYHDYSKSKSKKSSPEKTSDEARVQKVVTGNIIERKPGFMSRLREAFPGADARSVSDYVFWDVMVPALKDLTLDMISRGAERTLFGEVRTRRRSSGGTIRVDYNGISKRDRDFTDRDRPRELSSHARRTHNFREIVIEERGDAEDVLQALYDLIDAYGAATVADFYQAVGYTGEFTDNKWGWTSLDGSKIISVRGGWLIDLPKPEVID